jgi:pimeloyl-ACP methyl ester carboxylesterase
VTGLHVVERGPVDAPVVVLVHGSMDRANGMRPVARRLEEDYHVVATPARARSAGRTTWPRR